MSTKLLLLMLWLPLPVMAGWTGIAAFVGENNSDWIQQSTLTQANIDFYGLSIEEKTDVDLTVGASAGQFDVLLIDPLSVNIAEKYDGQFFSLYLRWPIRLAQNIKLHALFNYQFNLGSNSIAAESSEINWTEISLNVGLSYRMGLLSLRPFIHFRSIDGDISSATGTRLFKQDESVSQGLILDYFVERYAFVRLQAAVGGQRSMLLSFVREY